ncbi:hypothetical protein FRC02_004571 [Tulasnella sp. 418]|nr:hypothetical protein FRC02_004571 [Tulasnella sp. 418]
MINLSKSSTIYALENFNYCNLWIYLDAGHAGWLEWSANLTPAAQLSASSLTSARRPCPWFGYQRRHYYALRAAIANTYELKYINTHGSALFSNGFPAYFLIDQGLSDAQNIRDAWGNWCNIEGAGFGIHPTTNTGSS